MNPSLAIIIPAYKQEFLKETLDSIAAQTCGRFTLYIGDDASPENLYAVISEYEPKIDIVYKRFENNLGAHDLIAHWQRCLDLAKNEEWVWLFSDDDVMGPECVERFYQVLLGSPDCDLLHFGTNIIDQHGGIIKECAPFSQRLSVENFFSERTKFKINSSVVEYIFRKSHFQDCGGFQKYDLAWCADDATWIKLGASRGILTIPDSKVKWRYSGVNISSNITNKSIVFRKVSSSIKHIKWVSSFFRENNIHDKTSSFQKVKWILSVVVLTPSFSLPEKYKLLFQITKDLGYMKVRPVAMAYLLYWQLKKLAPESK
ncbi:glycosyltransferase family 2 protein [Dyadobacter psychrophilus]|uniref:Glycosyltransferase, GT2 family n=1 Tax=Dyadobacter psychrophilus TaxID=651661 RepID=A0A1T5HE78_9BACT|nr:glycosyltransferase family 2 protein [Dyadobacter psychrophilus]SKC18972.1 Glycosyltransferase, GT2 family [Dyadobacter psychrophilus]